MLKAPKATKHLVRRKDKPAQHIPAFGILRHNTRIRGIKRAKQYKVIWPEPWPLVNSAICTTTGSSAKDLWIK